MSTVTSRDQPSVVLKDTMRTGFLYSPAKEIAYERLAIGTVHVSLAPRASEPPTEIIEYQIGVLVGPVGHDGRRGTHDAILHSARQVERIPTAMMREPPCASGRWPIRASTEET